jgi:hypothetical protein
MAITPGQQGDANDFITKAERNATKTNDSGKVPQLESDGYLDPDFIKQVGPIVRVYTTLPTSVGSSTTQFDITNPSGTTFRYTYDGNGTDPAFSAANNPVGKAIWFNAQNFNAANNGKFVITASGNNYVEVTNASGVAENNKTIGTGAVYKLETWAKPNGLKYVEVEVQDAGNAGYGGAGASYAGMASTFGTYVKNDTGDLIIPGGGGESGIAGSIGEFPGRGGDSMLGRGGIPNIGTGLGYGSGGSGNAWTDGSYHGTSGGNGGTYSKKLILASGLPSIVAITVGIGGNPGGAANPGGWGAQGIVILKEFYF